MQDNALFKSKLIFFKENSSPSKLFFSPDQAVHKYKLDGYLSPFYVADNNTTGCVSYKEKRFVKAHGFGPRLEGHMW